MITSSNPSWQAAFGLLALRLFAAYEFLESGLEKLERGKTGLQISTVNFPFPFNLLPDTVNWNLAMWAELVLPALLSSAWQHWLSALGIDGCDGCRMVCGTCRLGLQCVRQRL